MGWTEKNRMGRKGRADLRWEEDGKMRRAGRNGQLQSGDRYQKGRK